MMITWHRPWLAAALAACFLQACGGDNQAPGTDPNTTVTPQSQSLRGSVLTTAGLRVANAQVQWGSFSVSTNAQGQFEFVKPGAVTEALRVTGTGYAPGVLRLPSSTAQDVVITLSNEGVSQNIDATNGGTVSVPSSTAQVVLPASGLIVEATGAAATGTATVTVTPIDPASQSGAMPGSYTVSVAGGGVAPIESFGAIHVSLQDAAGRKLNLAAGKKATIRIPVASRSINPPATIPLLYLDEATGIWKSEGQATLKGTVPNAYYEGEVAHFTYWNADQILDTVYLNGCVVDATGKAAAITVGTEGVDYSGDSFVITDAQGRFKVALKKNGKAKLGGSTLSDFFSQVIGPFAQDTTLNTCFKLGAIPNELRIAQQPDDVSGNAVLARFSVAVDGPLSVNYQWQVNGQDLPGGTGRVLTIWQGDFKSGDKFRVVVNHNGSTVTSREALLTIDQVPPPTLNNVPAPTTVSENGTLVLVAQASGTGPLRYQWTHDGQPLINGTATSLTITNFKVANAGSYRVTVSNNGGSVTSEPWVVSLGAPVIDTPIVPQSTTEAVLLQLLGVRELTRYIGADLGILEDFLGAISPVGSLCSLGGTATLTLDGQSVTAPAVLTPDVSHLIVGSFNQCADAGQSHVLNGQTSIHVRISGSFEAGRNVVTQSTMNNLSIEEDGAVVSGRIDVSSTRRLSGNSSSFVQTISPQTGASVRLPDNGPVMTFTGGSVTITDQASSDTMTGSSTSTFNDLSAMVNGTNFKVSGSMQITASANNAMAGNFSGEIVLTSGGATVGRIYGDSQGRPTMQVSGQQPVVLQP